MNGVGSHLKAAGKRIDHPYEFSKFAVANECASMDEADSLRAREPPPKTCSGWERRSARLWEIDELYPDRQQLIREGRF